MIRRSLLFISALFLAFIQIPSLTESKAQAQIQPSAGSTGTRFGVNAGEPSDFGYTDVMMSSGSWSLSSGATYSGNGYPTSGSSGTFFNLMADPPGLQTYNFYAEGVFTPGFSGAYLFQE
jgi:hypothetical protein